MKGEVVQEETQELIRLKSRLSRLRGMNLEPSPSSLSLGGRSSKATKRCPPELPSFIEERSARLLDSLTKEQLVEFQRSIDEKMQIALGRLIARCCKPR